MSELTESEIITKINDIDTQIKNITDTLGTAGTGAVNFLNYTVGGKSVDGSTRLKQLIDTREAYQKLLEKIPKVFIRDHGYDIEHGTGEDKTEYIGDE